jgi:RNA polymerase sigma-70 factor, ECF subfamily
MTSFPDNKATLFNEIESHRSYLIRFAVSRLREADAAEEVVQEALLAALDGISNFAGGSTLRTWLTSILKFKIIDHQRRVVAERERFVQPPAEAEDADTTWLDRMFDDTGHWRAPMSTWATPDDAASQKAFFNAFENCMDKLAPATARVFFQREVLGEETEDICKAEAISSSNCWVMLHRARLSLRECLERSWFSK